MAEEDFGRGPGSAHPAPARTPHPRRLLLVGRVAPGHEVRVRYWQARFPTEAAQAAGIAAAEAFVGSGYYALALELAEEDAQRVLAAYFNDPTVRAFHRHLGQFVEGLPDPERVFVPSSRGDDGYASGDLPLAAGMYRWRAGEAPDTGEDSEQRAECRCGPA